MSSPSLSFPEGIFVVKSSAQLTTMGRRQIRHAVPFHDEVPCRMTAGDTYSKQVSFYCTMYLSMLAALLEPQINTLNIIINIRHPFINFELIQTSN